MRFAAMRIWELPPKVGNAIPTSYAPSGGALQRQAHCENPKPVCFRRRAALVEAGRCIQLNRLLRSNISQASPMVKLRLHRMALNREKANELKGNPVDPPQYRALESTS